MSFVKRIPQDRAGELFSVLGHDETDHLFLLEPKSLGFGFLCEPLYFADEKTADRINVLLNQDWPVNTIAQFILWGGPDIEQALDQYDSLSIPLPGLVGELRPKTIEFLRGKTSAPLGASGNLQIRNLVMIMTVRVPINSALPNKKDLEKMAALRKAVEQALSTGGFFNQALTAESYIRLMSTIVNQGPQASWKNEPPHMTRYDPNYYVRDQIFDYDTEVKIDSKGLWLGEKRIKVLSVKRFPEHAVMGTARRFLSETLTGNRGIRENVLISASLLFPDSDGGRSKLEREKQWVTNQAYGPMLKFAPRLAAQKNSFDALFEALDDGDRIVKLYLGMVLFCDKDNQESAVSNARSYWRESGYQLMEDRFLCLPLFLNCLPFGAEPEAAKDLMRYRTMGTRHALTQLPLFGSWKGTGTPLLELAGRDGQLMQVDPFDSESNYNLVIAAASGKGKSFLVNDLILNTIATGGKAWVIDIGRSYEKLTHTIDGQFLSFGSDSKICMNPFDLVEDYEEEADMLVELVATMAAPTVPLDDYQNSALRRFMRDTWAEEGREMTIDSLAPRLINSADRRIQDIGHQLYPFTSAGEYGRFFNGRNNVSFSDNLAVVELEELNARKHLQQVILLQMIFQIQRDMYLGKRDRRKVVVIDEAWALLAGGRVAQFIEAGYRKFRKYGGMAVVCTQSLNDLYESPGGVAIIENSANKYLLGQNREVVAALEREKRLDIGEFGFDLLKTVHTIRGEYSEIFFITEYGSGIGRLYVSDFKKLLYSTTAQEVETINGLVAQGMSHSEAIEHLLHEKRRIA